MALLPFKLRIKTIEPQDYSQPIGYLAGVKEISQVQIPSALIPQEQMEKEMLILAGITGNLFDQVLLYLAESRYTCGLQAGSGRSIIRTGTVCSFIKNWRKNIICITRLK